jgi:ribonuclease BN (tRNA processing enzyme)
VAKRPVAKKAAAKKAAPKKAAAKKAAPKKAAPKKAVARKAVASKAKPAPKPNAKPKSKPVPKTKPVLKAKPAPKARASAKPAPVAAPVLGLEETRAHWLARALARPHTGTSLIMLGTGMPRPDPTCFGPATAVVCNGRTFLFDVGAGVMRRMAAAGLSYRGPEAAFITHLHSDHTLGYPDLIFTTWVMGRREKMKVYGPVGLKHMTRHIIAAWKEDIQVRTEGLEHNTKGGYRVEVHEFDAGVVYDHEGVRITAIPVQHGCWKQAYGFRIDTPDRSIVISGDTKPCSAILEASRGVDVLVHEVYPFTQVAPEKRVGGEVWPSYMAEFHTSDLELGIIAGAARPKGLVLHHIVRHGKDDELLLAAIRAGGYYGEVVVAKDLDRY